MPLEKTFWAERFGMLVDRFGRVAGSVGRAGVLTLLLRLGGPCGEQRQGLG